MDPRQLTPDSTAATDPSATVPPESPGTADPAAPDIVIVETVSVVATGVPAAEATASGTEATTETAPLSPEDVHVRPPDHLPEGTVPEAENVGLIFERS